jgi:hypothetical protein
MSAVPAIPALSPGRLAAELAQSRAIRVALGASALAAITALLARRVDLSSLSDADVVWSWIALSLVLNLASVAGKAVVWKAALDALPGQRPVRYGHVVPALFIGFLLNTVLFARVGELARVAVLGRRQKLAGDSIPASTIGGTLLAEQLVLAAALALAIVALAPVLHLPLMVWQLLVVFVAALAAVLGVLTLLLRNARGRFANLATGLSRGQALFSKPRATVLALTAGTLSWATQIAGIWAALEAFNIHVGLAGAGVVFVSSTIVQLFPFWPGNLGIFQLGVAAPLVSAYGISTANAVAFSVGLQFVEGLLGVGLGLAFLAREGLSLSGARRLATEPDAGYGSGAPAHASTTPMAPAHSSVSTVPRPSASSATAAAARTPNCQISVNAAASVTAAPRIAPIAAGPAPSRKARAPAFSRSRLKRSPPSRMNENDGVNATAAASSPPRSPCAA